MASRADEGRGKTAISLGLLSSKHSRGSPNEATHSGKTGVLLAQHIGQVEVSGGSETSQYPEEKKTYSLSSGERTGTSPNHLSFTALWPMLKWGSKTGCVQYRMDEGVTNPTLAESLWKELPQTVIVR